MVGVATGEMIRKHPDALRDLVAGWTKSTGFTYDHPDEAALLMSKRFSAETLPPDIAKSAVHNMVKIDYWSRGEIDFKGLEFFLETMRRQGEFKGKADWKAMTDQSFLPKSMRS